MQKKKSCMHHYVLINPQSLDKYEDGSGDHACPLHINGGGDCVIDGNDKLTLKLALHQNWMLCDFYYPQ